MMGKEGRSLALINQPVCQQDVRPPGQRKKPIPHHLYAGKKENLGNDQRSKSCPTVKRKGPTTRQGFHLSSLGIGDCGLLIGEMVLRHGVMRKCIKKLSENAKSFLAAYLRMKSPLRNPNSVCSYRLFPIKSTTFALLHDLFPR